MEAKIWARPLAAMERRRTGRTAVLAAMGHAPMMLTAREAVVLACELLVAVGKPTLASELRRTAQ